MADLTVAPPIHLSRQLQCWFWALLGLNLLFVIWSGNYLRPLQSREIVRFEIAKEVAVAKNIVEEWTDTPGAIHLSKAIESIYTDYLFIVLYVSLLSIACIYLSRLTGHEVLKRAGKFFQILVAGAGISDMVENLAIWYSLHGRLNNWNVTVAYDMALTKFSIIIVTLLFLLVCLIFYLVRKINKEHL